MNKVRVTRNPTWRHTQGKWWVQCSYCSGHGGDFFGALFTQPLGWAKDWRTAQDYATRHALEHEQTRCVTCLHVPSAPVPSTPSKENA